MYLWLGLLGSPGLARAQDTRVASPTQLTEAEVIRLARDRSPAAAVASATERLAQARTHTAGLLPNPSLGWSHETVRTGPISGQGSQDILGAAVPIDVARPLSARSLVASEGAWMRAEASLARTEGILAAVMAYYDVVLATRRADILAQSLDHLGEAARVLVSKEAAGEASGYESTRLAVASEIGRSHLVVARAALESQKVRLAILLGRRSESLRVATGLTLMSAAEEAALARRGGAMQPAVQQARESQRLAGEAEDRAAWAWLPALELGAGMKRANNAGSASGYGYVLGASLSLPFFDRGQAEREPAEAQRALAAARAEALTRTLDAEVQSALATFRAAREELERFETRTSGPADALLKAAQSGYREGERSIVELLDAQRTQIEVAERRLGLLGAAKRAEVRLRAAGGVLQ